MRIHTFLFNPHVFQPWYSNNIPTPVASSSMVAILLLVLVFITQHSLLYVTNGLIIPVYIFDLTLRARLMHAA